MQKSVHVKVSHHQDHHISFLLARVSICLLLRPVGTVYMFQRSEIRKRVAAKDFDHGKGTKQFAGEQRRRASQQEDSARAQLLILT